MKKAYIQPQTENVDVLSNQVICGVSVYNDPHDQIESEAPRRKYIGHLIYS